MTTVLQFQRLGSSNAPNRRARVFSNMIPITHRPSHGLATASNGTDTWANSRIMQIATADAEGLALSYANYYDGNKVLVTSLSLTVSAAIEYNGVTYPVFFNGSRTVNIFAGGLGVTSTPVGIKINKGDTYWVRTLVTVPSGQAWPHMLTSRAGSGEGCVRGSGTVSDRTLTGTITASSEGVYTAQAVLADAVSVNNIPTALPVVGNIGDSISWGQGEAAPETDKGFMKRAMTTLNLAEVRMDRDGGRLFDFISVTGNGGSSYRGTLIPACSTVVCSDGVNDLNQGRTLAQLQADSLTLWSWAAGAGARVFQTTLTPWVTSTDSVTTVANQTVTSWEASRTAYNDWLRAGAPIDPVARTAVLAGTAGALVAGSWTHPLYGIFDIADSLETARNSGRWKVPGVVGTATTTNGSAVLTNVVATSGIFANDLVVVGTGIPAQTAIISGGGTSSLTMSANATASASNVALTTSYSVDGIHPGPAGHAIAGAVLSADPTLFV